MNTYVANFKQRRLQIGIMARIACQTRTEEEFGLRENKDWNHIKEI